MVEGQLRSDEWEDKQGQRRTTIEVNASSVQTLDWQDRSGGGGSGGGPSRPDAPPEEEPIPEDDIPF